MTKYDPDARPDYDAVKGVGENASGEIVPMEAVIPEKDSKKMHAQAEFAEQLIEERRKRASEPVHMEGLKPLPAEMRSKTPGAGVIPGGPEALGLAPAMRRTIPPPFRRERISIEHHGKTWAYARADSVREGDIVVDFGKVERATSRVHYEQVAGKRAAVGEDVVLVNMLDQMQAHDPAEQLRVFRVHGEQQDGEH